MSSAMRKIQRKQIAADLKRNQDWYRYVQRFIDEHGPVEALRRVWMKDSPSAGHRQRHTRDIRAVIVRGRPLRRAPMPDRWKRCKKR